MSLRVPFCVAARRLRHQASRYKPVYPEAAAAVPENRVHVCDLVECIEVCIMMHGFGHHPAGLSQPPWQQYAETRSLGRSE